MPTKRPVLHVLAIVTLLSLQLTSCSENSSINEFPAETASDAGGVVPRCVVDDQSFVADVAGRFDDVWQSVDCESLLAYADDFVALYGNHCLPKQMRGTVYTAHPATRLLKQLQSSLNKGDCYGISRAYMSYIYAFPFFSGECEPKDGRKTWELVAESRCVSVHFRDSEGRNCEIVAEPSETIGAYNVPSEIIVTIRRGVEVLSSATIAYKTADNGDVTAEVDASVGELRIVSTTMAASARLTHDVGVSVSGDHILGTSVEGYGSNLSNRTLVGSIFSLESGSRLYSMVNDAQSTIDVMGQVQLRSVASGSMLNLLQTFDCCRFDTADLATVAVADMNASMTTLVNYNEENVERGVVTWQTHESLTRVGEWDVQPVITFDADGSKLAYLDLFDENKLVDFASLWHDMLESYEAMWH